MAEAMCHDTDDSDCVTVDGIDEGPAKASMLLGKDCTSGVRTAGVYVGESSFEPASVTKYGSGSNKTSGITYAHLMTNEVNKHVVGARKWVNVL